MFYLRCPKHIVLCFLFSSSCVLHVASFSGFSIFDCLFGILVCLYQEIGNIDYWADDTLVD